MNKIVPPLLIILGSLLFAGCLPRSGQEAVSTQRPASPPETTSEEPAPLSDDEVENVVEQNLEAELDEELEDLEAELDAIEKELGSY